MFLSICYMLYSNAVPSITGSHPFDPSNQQLTAEVQSYPFFFTLSTRFKKKKCSDWKLHSRAPQAMWTTIKIFNVILRGLLSTSQSMAKAFVHVDDHTRKSHCCSHRHLYRRAEQGKHGYLRQRTSFIFLLGGSSASQGWKTLPYKELSTGGSLHTACLQVYPCNTLRGRERFHGWGNWVTGAFPNPPRFGL